MSAANVLWSACTEPTIFPPVGDWPDARKERGRLDGRDRLAAAFEEADLRAGLNDGGQVLCAFIVARGEDAFVIYLRCNWIRGRGFRIIRTWRGSSGDRTFKNLHSAWRFVRKFNFTGRVTVYPSGDPDLQQFRGVSPEDLGTIIDGPPPPVAHQPSPDYLMQ